MASPDFVELSISCRGLRKADKMSSSDPMVILYEKEPTEADWTEKDKTEIIEDNINPDFVKKFHVAYDSEKRVELRLELYDVDSEKGGKIKKEALGFTECALGALANSGKYEDALKPFQGKKAEGTIIICAEVIPVEMKDKSIQLEFGAEGMPPKTKLDGFLSISKKSLKDDGYTVVYQTEHAKDTTPDWRPFNLSFAAINGGHTDRQLKLELFSFKKGGSHTLVGDAEITFEALAAMTDPTDIKLTYHPDPKNKKAQEAPDLRLKLKKMRVSG